MWGYKCVPTDLALFSRVWDDNSVLSDDRGSEDTWWEDAGKAGLDVLGLPLVVRTASRIIGENDYVLQERGSEWSRDSHMISNDFIIHRTLQGVGCQ